MATGAADVALTKGLVLIGEAALESTATVHGAGRLRDAARMGFFRSLATRIFATAKYTQADGAEVFVRNVAGKFDVVIRNPTTGKIITVFKNLSQKSLDKLARNYGW